MRGGCKFVACVVVKVKNSPVLCGGLSKISRQVEVKVGLPYQSMMMMIDKETR